MVLLKPKRNLNAGNERRKVLNTKKKFLKIKNMVTEEAKRPSPDNDAYRNTGSAGA
jgi:hypothetical protein